MADSESLLEIEPSGLLLSAFKPAEGGQGVVVRILNTKSTAQEARVTIGFPFEKAEMLRLDETPESSSPRREGQTLHFSVPPHALRSVGIE